MNKPAVCFQSNLSYNDLMTGMCTRSRRDPRPMSPRPRLDQDIQNFVRDETETRRLKSRTRPRRDVASSETLVETLKLPRLSLTDSQHGKRFLFVILWVFALYFDMNI